MITNVFRKSGMIIAAITVLLLLSGCLSMVQSENTPDTKQQAAEPVFVLPDKPQTSEMPPLLPSEEALPLPPSEENRPSVPLFN